MNKTTEILKELEAQHHNPQTKQEFAERMESFQRGENHSMEEHIKYMILAMMTASRVYEPIKLHLNDLEEIFYHYDAEKLKNADPEVLIHAIRKIRCGNRRIKFQMYALRNNIMYLQSIVKEHTSIDAFYRSFSKYDLVKTLNSNLKEMGVPLISEYLPSVGIDLPKPDVHIRRILGSERLGYSKRKKATIRECYHIVHDISVETNEYEKYIDYLLWAYCAAGEKNICGAAPHCDKCVIRQYCNMGK